MMLINKRETLIEEISRLKTAGKSIGFVPTMGALHRGHIFLVEKCVAENNVAITSIFVNPTQFNNPEDLKKYPRHLDEDVQLLEKAGCRMVFAPEATEMYDTSELTDTFEFDFGGLDNVMEGKFRPGHFNGVVQVVSKLFRLVQPDRAYFGEKDFQQLAIIHRMVQLMNFPVEIVDCPIVREESGLAMSSRNERLSPEERKKAATISKVLSESRTFAATMSPSELQQWITTKINEVPELEAEYVEIVDSVSLQPANTVLNQAICCVAVFCGGVRLIDNIRYNTAE